MKITHDFHVHTHLSPCGKESATFDNYLPIFKRLGLKKVGVADHFWDSAIEGANGFYSEQSYEKLSALKDEFVKNTDPDLKIYFGCECEYDPRRRGVAMTPETAEKFDFIIVPNSHTHMMMPKDCYEPYEKHAQFMLTAYEDIIKSEVSRYITAMAHPFAAVACPYDNGILLDLIDDDSYRRLFDMTAEKGIAFEINVNSMKKKTPEQIAAMPQIRVFRLAKECGCRFIFGSDAHSDTVHGFYGNADITAEILGLKEDDIAEIAR